MPAEVTSPGVMYSLEGKMRKASCSAFEEGVHNSP